jgi:hypothetical protein
MLPHTMVAFAPIDAPFSTIVVSSCPSDYFTPGIGYIGNGPLKVEKNIIVADHTGVD